MNCLEFQERLQSQLDRQPVGDGTSLEHHLASCPDCRQLHQAAQRLEEGLRHLAPPCPPVGLADRIVTRALGERQARLRFRRRLLAVAAIAASLLLTALAGYYWFLRPTDQGPVTPEPIANKPPEPEPQPKETPAPSLRESVADATDAVAGLAQRTTDETVGSTWLLWSVVVAPPLKEPAELPPPFDPTARSLREAGQGLSTGLEPLANSARRAFGLFLRDIPNMETEGKPGL